MKHRMDDLRRRLSQGWLGLVTSAAVGAVIGGVIVALFIGQIKVDVALAASLLMLLLSPVVLPVIVVVLTAAVLLGFLISITVRPIRKLTRKSASNRVLYRVKEFRTLLSPTNEGKSVFSRVAIPQGMQQSDLWAKYCDEKRSWIDSFIECQVMPYLSEAPDQAFERLCQCSLELGNFITFFHEYFERQNLFDNKLRDWYNGGPIKAYADYVNKLTRAAEDLSLNFGQSIKEHASRVEAQTPKPDKPRDGAE